MIFTDCKLLRDTGGVFAELTVVDVKFRAQSTTQPDSAALWYGTLIPASCISISESDVFSLQLTETVTGVIRFLESSDQGNTNIRFYGVADRPDLANPPEMEPAAKKCAECRSLFFGSASQMDGLCPECAHYLYGYSNCDHIFSQKTCSQCGWDGSESEYIRQIKRHDDHQPD
ncbi:hypothetical protein HG66A1_10280 [Gimesia chilikensis]|uniref:Uncharacterized protein n=1 Tax=Gimesia chilikensis TaxID=2605989 RepID=A0A517PIQ3_9PLAN|nr:hypothetical protein HG66A1_10280 [Gimesia chilikensis]